MNPKNNGIDTVLAALRDAEASETLQQRLQAALRAAAEDEPAPHAWTRLSLLAPYGATLAAVCVFTITAVLVVRGRLHQQNPQTAVTMTDKPAQAVHSGNVQQRVIKRVEAKSRDVSPSPQRRLSAIAAKDLIPREVATINAPERSFPAPAMPLTRQERLLVRVAHRNDPVQLAMLLPAVREDDFQRGKAQVREFFKSPTLPAIDLPESNDNPNGVTQ